MNLARLRRNQKCLECLKCAKVPRVPKVKNRVLSPLTPNSELKTLNFFGHG